MIHPRKANWTPGQDFCGPWSTFRFRTWELEHLFNGQEHVLLPGRDFPYDAPYAGLQRRLRTAAQHRWGGVRVWKVIHAMDRVEVHMIGWTGS